jgi:hypothetical protein
MRIRFLGKSMPELFKELNEIFDDQPNAAKWAFWAKSFINQKTVCFTTFTFSWIQDLRLAEF